MRSEIIEEMKSRRENSSKPTEYVTDAILEGVFDWFLKRKLTVQENAASWWYRNGKKEMECYGYSGYSINNRDDLDGMMWNMAHEIWCKAEWLARGLKEGWYINSCKEYFGMEVLSAFYLPDKSQT